MDPFITSHESWASFRRELPSHVDSARYLSAESAKCLAIERISVVDSPLPKPGTSPNDYVSQAPYWWPDPAKPDGLPYIRRDGETNPEHQRSDRGHLEWLCDSVTCLTLSAHATNSAEAARQAGRLLRGWFLEPATRMNPQLRHAQFIPGVCAGRGIGLIDTGILCPLLDTVRHLPFSSDWTPADLEGLMKWLADYLDWFLESDLGRTECAEHNNHGVWYDTQVVCFAIVCGRQDTARHQLETFTRKRIASQIEPDGRQPHELARTLSLSYCTFNLTGLAILAQVAQSLDLDLWQWTTPDGRGIQSAIRWMLPYYLGQKAWAHRQINAFSRPAAAYLLSLAAQGTGHREFATAYDQLAEHPWTRISSWRTGVRKFNFPSA